MALDSTGLFNELLSAISSLGVFDKVNAHEPKNAPGHGITCSIYVNNIAPARTSGLASCSAVVVFNVRVYNDMLQEPQDTIDIDTMQATDSVINALAGDFDLGGLARNVDFFGYEGTKVTATAGYITIDNKMYRAMTIVVPVIVNDVWEQVQ